ADSKGRGDGGRARSRSDAADARLFGQGAVRGGAGELVKTVARDHHAATGIHREKRFVGAGVGGEAAAGGGGRGADAAGDHEPGVERGGGGRRSAGHGAGADGRRVGGGALRP